MTMSVIPVLKPTATNTMVWFSCGDPYLDVLLFMISIYTDVMLCECVVIEVSEFVYIVNDLGIQLKM